MKSWAELNLITSFIISWGIPGPNLECHQIMDLLKRAGSAVYISMNAWKIKLSWCGLKVAEFDASVTHILKSVVLRYLTVNEFLSTTSHIYSLNTSLFKDSSSSRRSESVSCKAMRPSVLLCPLSTVVALRFSSLIPSTNERSWFNLDFCKLKM